MSRAGYFCRSRRAMYLQGMRGFIAQHYGSKRPVVGCNHIGRYVHYRKSSLNRFIQLRDLHKRVLNEEKLWEGSEIQSDRGKMECVGNRLRVFMCKSEGTRKSPLNDQIPSIPLCATPPSKPSFRFLPHTKKNMQTKAESTPFCPYRSEWYTKRETRVPALLNL